MSIKAWLTLAKQHQGEDGTQTRVQNSGPNSPSRVWNFRPFSDHSSSRVQNTSPQSDQARASVQNAIFHHSIPFSDNFQFRTQVQSSLSFSDLSRPGVQNSSPHSDHSDSRIENSSSSTRQTRAKDAKPSPYSFHTVHLDNRTVAAVTVL